VLKQLGGNRSRLLWLEAKSAHAMGIIGNELKSQLDRFRSIRNAFAHAMLSVSFDDELIAAECRSPPHSQFTSNAALAYVGGNTIVKYPTASASKNKKVMNHGVGENSAPSYPATEKK
jgi:hypothetical protein